MSRPHRIAILAYEGCQLLDVTGPAAVFGAANEALRYPAYDLRIVSPDGGAVASNSGVALMSEKLGGQPDTLVVAGGSRGLRAIIAREDARRWACRVAPRSQRYGSVCSGALVLAAWGLLDDKRVATHWASCERLARLHPRISVDPESLYVVDGKRVATHWASCERLARAYPQLSVDPDQLYVVDGKVWTSAGVTTGIDMALAIVEADHGAAVANEIARHFVLYARRPGYQSQFSPVLQAQVAADAPFAALIDWMQHRLDKPLDVPELARRAGLSERSFYRKFTQATGKTPAHFVETLRLDAARTLMAKGLPLKSIAARVGLRSSARLGQAFERRFGMAPSLFREMHAG